MRLHDDPLADGIDAYGRRLRAGQTTARATTEAYLARIQARDPELGAYRHINPTVALAMADAVDQNLRAGIDPGPLAGVPVGVKDLFVVDGMPTGAGTDLDVADIIGSEEGPLMRRLRELGCVFLGKTKTVEFALGIPGVSKPHGTPRNPCDDQIARVPGGSSSGSAVAVAAGLCGFAIGSDTGGSVRIPAALCGIVGIKPTQDRWSARGAFPLAEHLDTPGILVGRARDARLISEAIDGTQAVIRPLAELSFGIPRDYFLDDLDPSVAQAFEQAIAAIRTAGGTVHEIEALPGARDREAYFPAVLGASIVAVLGRERYARSRHLVDPVIRRRIDAGREVTGDVILSLEWARKRAVAEAAECMASFDALLVPTSAALPPPLGEFDDPETSFRLAAGMSRNTQPGNYLNLCGASVPIQPAGMLPVGLQILCRAGEDQVLFGLAETIDTALLEAGCR